MKKLFTTLLIGLISLSTFASHLMGGQIVATNLGGYEYEIKLTAYRDTMGIPMATYATFQITMDSAGVITPITTLTVLADSMSGGLVMGVSAAYGVEVYTYTDTITFYQVMDIIQYIGKIVVEMLPSSIWVMLEPNLLHYQHHLM